MKVNERLHDVPCMDRPSHRSIYRPVKARVFRHRHRHVRSVNEDRFLSQFGVDNGDSSVVNAFFAAISVAWQKFGC